VGVTNDSAVCVGVDNAAGGYGLRMLQCVWVWILWLMTLVLCFFYAHRVMNTSGQCTVETP